MTKDEALNVASQCKVTSNHQLCHNISVDGGNGLLSELLFDAARVIEALAQPEQEPVAWIDMSQWPPIRWRDGMIRKDVDQFDGQGLYTSPPTACLLVGLTDEEIDALVIDKDGLPNSHLEFARAIEAKLKEKNT